MTTYRRARAEMLHTIVINRDAEMRKILRCGRIERSSAAAEDRSFPGSVLSTDAVARDGHRVFGWIVPDSRSVPLVDSHQDQDGIDRVLGRVTGIHSGAARAKRDGVLPAPLLGTPGFVGTDVNPRAGPAFGLYAGGICDALSVSFLIREATPARDRGPGALDIAVAELLEVSVVAVPSDVNAKVLRALEAQRRGRATSEDRRIIARAIAARGATSTLQELGYYRDDAERHVKRAVRLHGKLLKHHDAAGEQVDDLDGVRTRFAALGYAGREFTRCLSDLKRCARGLRSVHADAGDVHERLGDALENAQGSLANDDDDTGDSTGIAPYKTLSEHDTEAARAARVKRARLLALGSNDPLARSPEQALLRHQDR